METTRIDITYRPLRIGWAIDAGDFEGFRKAVRLSHAFWGGRFNPFLVIDKAVEAEELTKRYSVDLVWPVSSTESVKKFAAKFKHLPSPIFGDDLIHEDGSSEVLDVRNALAFFRDKPEWQKIKDQGVRIFDWKKEDKLSDVLLMHAGAYPELLEDKGDYRSLLRRATAATEEFISDSAKLPTALAEHFNISHFSRIGLTVHDGIYGASDPGIYVGDADNFEDLITCWNLRAADIPLWFVDKRSVERYADLLPLLLKRDPELSKIKQWPRSQEVALWTRGDPKADAKLLGDYSFDYVSVPPNGLKVRVPAVSIGETSVLGVVGLNKGRPRISFAYGAKPFTGSLWFHQQKLVASLLCRGVLLIDAKHLFCPPYLPELNEFYARSMAWNYAKLRSEPKSVGLIVGAHDHDGSLLALSFEDLMVRIFHHVGYEAKVSSGGLIARQLIDQLGGLQGARVFKIPGVRRLVKTFGLNDPFTRKAALELIGSTDPENPSGKFSDHENLYIEQRTTGTPLRSEDALGYLVEKGLLRLGIEVNCPHCRMTTWISINTLGEKVSCERCGYEHNAARQLASSKWQFRRSGILGVEKDSQGAIPVAVTLQQLDTSFSGPMDTRVFSPSLDLNPLSGASGKKREIDFVWLMNERDWDDHRTVVIIGECKDQGVIDANDMNGLREVADSFPKDHFEVFIVLAKIATFTTAEIEQAKKLNSKGVRRVIMLTARELEPYSVYERTRKEFPAVNSYGSSPHDMAENTHRIYFSDIPGK
jgi:hypothetical protein